MELRLQDKVAIVTGGSRGIGKAIAEALAFEGMKVVICSRNRDDLEKVAATAPDRIRVFSADLRLGSSQAALIDFANSEYGRIDALVNNAGATVRGDFLDLTETQWKEGFDLKFFAAVGCTRHAWAPLAQTQGTVVNIVGIGGRTGAADFAIGGAVNSALLNLTKALSCRGEPDNIRVNAINPGFIKTERLLSRIQGLAQRLNLPLAEAEKRMKQESGIFRFGEPEDIASVVAFLVSTRSRHIRGAVIDVDGGSTRTL